MKIAVSISVGTLPLATQAKEVLQTLERLGVGEPVVILAGHTKLDPQGCKLAQKAKEVLGEGVFLAFTDTGSFSRAYLKGWEVGIEKGADFVISMDADGSHDPAELICFIEMFEKGQKAVCSSRFMGGSENRYPLLRQALSLGITFLANLSLGVKGTQKLTDFASGYEGLHKEVIQSIFRICPPDEWISVTRGPYHLQNTILRMLIMMAGYSIIEIPIRYGIRRTGKVLGVRYVVGALLGFYHIHKEKQKYLARVVS